MAYDLQAVPSHQTGLQHALYRTAHGSGQAGAPGGRSGQRWSAAPVAAGGAYEKAYEIDAGNRVIAYHLADLLFEQDELLALTEQKETVPLSVSDIRFMTLSSNGTQFAEEKKIGSIVGTFCSQTEED